MQNNVFYTNKTLNVRGRLLDLRTPRIMGILNVTPDSFFDGGRFINEKAALTHASKMLEDGADLIDVGGASSRPGASSLSEDEEVVRVLPVIESLVKHFPGAVLSVDTFRSAVARRAVEAGASIINDISGGDQDPLMFGTAASLNAPYVLMHMRGTPETMTTLTTYDDLIRDIVKYFEEKILLLGGAGVKDIIIDPGFGFAKTVTQNFELLNHLEHFKILGLPILVGLSRKSLVWKTLGITPEEALNGTTTLHSIALLKGASILRVHDVKEAVDCIKLVTQLHFK